MTINQKSRWFLLVSAMMCVVTASESNAQDLSRYFKNTAGCLVLYDLKRNHFLRYNEKRCRQRFSPFSTFKIPNSLIGLETGVIKDAEFVIPWDKQKYPPQEQLSDDWRKDQTLRSAFRYSVVWYYRELALRVGEATMKKYVAAFGYGNQDISSGLDRFWLASSLQISADEQIAFLKTFHQGKLPVSQRSVEIVKEILIREQTGAYTLSAKTGGGPLGNGKYLGWYVGYLETKGNVYFFALNIEGDSFTAIRDERINLTHRILTDLGYLRKPQAKQ